MAGTAGHQFDGRIHLIAPIAEFMQANFVGFCGLLGKIQRMTGDYIGKEVYMGIRPENIHDEPAFTGAYPEAYVEVKVEMTELMGSETYLYLSTDGKEGNFIARVDPRTNSRGGDIITVGFDVNRLHFFDAETEKNHPEQGLIGEIQKTPL